MLLRILLILSCTLAIADEPLSPPSLKTIYSANGVYRAVLDPKADRTTVFVVKNGSNQELWSIQGWYREAHLSNNGLNLVTGYDGLNLIPRSYGQEMVMLSFFASGKLVKQIRLNQLILDFHKLQATVSHYYWGDYLGLDEEGRFRVKTVEGRTLFFNPVNGCLIKEEK